MFETEMINDLTCASPRFAIFQSTGDILENRFPTDQLEKIHAYIKELDGKFTIGAIDIKIPWVYFFITKQIIIVLPVKIGKKKYAALFKEISQKYAMKLEQRYRKSPKTMGSLIKFHLFSVARSAGPEPIAWHSISPYADLNEAEQWSYAMTSLMVLVNQTVAEDRNILIFHPFLEEKQLGLLYLFKIPLKNARGGAFDACFMSVVDYEERNCIYAQHEKLEEIYKSMAYILTRMFQKYFESNIDAEIENMQPFVDVLKKTQNILDNLYLKAFTSEHIRNNMLHSINEIKQKLDF